VSRFLSVRSSEPVSDASSCEGCAKSRREFLGRISLGVLATAVSLELGASGADAFPITFAEGTQVAANQRSYPIPATDGATIDKTDEVIVARVHQQVFAFNLACPHENTALRWRAEDVRFQCPRHGSKYQPDGTFISGRATRNMDRFAVQRSGDTIVVDLNRLFRSDQQAAQWASAVVAV
jgi:nitrite reductase/ring-hydroxylating ferredoxin subunit